MGLLDDIPEPKRMPTTGRYRYSKRDFEPDSNFEDLQNLGHRKQSEDFADSPFADRQPEQEEKQV